MNGLDLAVNSVPDPTDFPPPTKAPGLRTLDAALRCEICGENFDAPVVLPCGHTFCSFCVRQSLKERKACPNCRKKADEFNLVRNLALEEAVEQWKDARSFILQMINNQNPVNNTNKKRSQKATGSTPKEHKQPQKKRKDFIIVDHSSYKRQKTSPVQSPPEKHESDVDDLEDTVVEVGPSSPRKSIEHVPTSDLEEEEIELNEDGMVECPMCEKSTRSDRINEHIDSGCQKIFSSAGGPSKAADSKRAWQGLFQSAANKSSGKGKGKLRASQSPEDEEERLPKASYDLLKEKYLREMLQKHQLPTNGSKQVLAARHGRYVMLYNANLDRAKHKRKSLSDLRKELAKWEQLRDAKKPATSSSSREYELANKAQFQALTDAARQSRKANGTNTRKGGVAVVEANHDNVSIVLDSEDEL